MTAAAHDVFVSYAHADTDAGSDRNPARTLAEILEAEGYSVWWDRQLLGGDDWSRQLEQMVRFSKRVIGLCSPRSIESKWCHGEMWLASNTPGKLIPVIIEDCKLPAHLAV